MESLIINFKILQNQDITPEELLFLYYLYTKDDGSMLKINVSIQELQEKQFLKIINEEETNYIELRQKAIDLIDLLTIEINITNTGVKTIKKSKRAINQELENNLELFRNKWKGLKAGSMGSPKSCREKLYRWMSENPNYTIDKILKAADMYLASLSGDYRFLQRADYFIFKQENHREESSRLSAFIDEVDTFTTEDWTSNLQ
jgi:hypothetical protein